MSGGAEGCLVLYTLAVQVFALLVAVKVQLSHAPLGLWTCMLDGPPPLRTLHVN